MLSDHRNKTLGRGDQCSGPTRFLSDRGHRRGRRIENNQNKKTSRWDWIKPQGPKEADTLRIINVKQVHLDSVSWGKPVHR